MLVAKSSQSAAVKLARRKAAITELSDKHYFKDGIKPSSRNISRRLSLQPRSKSADMARRLQEAGKYRALGDRERALHRIHLSRGVRIDSLGPRGKHEMRVLKSNVREYPYLSWQGEAGTGGDGRLMPVAKALIPKSRGGAFLLGAASGVAAGAASFPSGQRAYRRIKTRRVIAEVRRNRRRGGRVAENPQDHTRNLDDVMRNDPELAAYVNERRQHMPNWAVGKADVAKSSNVREYEYLPEWVRESFAPGPALRPVLNPLNLYASGRLMVESAATADGRRLSRRKKRKLANAERQFAQGRMMLYSPLGRGSVVYE